jgi:hypothetical protein
MQPDVREDASHDEDGPMNERYQPRRDLSGMRLQGGYVAKQCPLRVHYDAFPPAGAVPMVESPADRLRMDAGNTFEAEVFAAIGATLQVVVDLSEERDPQATFTRRWSTTSGEAPDSYVARPSR